MFAASYYCKVISIHAPHEGERHGIFIARKQRDVISIHAPHEGERQTLATRLTISADFNPRSPRGGATFSVAIWLLTL